MCVAIGYFGAEHALSEQRWM